MFCKQCGKIIPNGAAFCEYCGTPALENNTQQQNYYAQQNNPFQPANNPQPSQNFNQQPMGSQPQNFGSQPQNFGSQPQNFGAQPQPMHYTDYPPAAPMTANNYSSPSVAAAAPKKKSKALITTLIITGTVIVLAVAAFFIVRLIIQNSETQYMKDNPTAYSVNSFQKTLTGISSGNEILSPIAQESNQATIKVTSGNYMFMYSADVDSHKNYAAAKVGSALNAGIFTNGDKTEIKLDTNDESYNYYVNNDENLRADAAKSIFGPQGENIFNIDQESFDSFIDGYESVMKAIKSANPEDEKTKQLIEKIEKTMDTDGHVVVSYENVNIDGQQVDADTITYTFNDYQFVDDILNDIKEWADGNPDVNEDVKNAINEAIQSYNESKKTAEQKPFTMTLKIYLNKNNHLIMLAEENLTIDSTDNATVKMCFGADPSNTDKISIESKIGTNEMKVELTHTESADADTYTLSIDNSSDNSSSTSKSDLSYSTKLTDSTVNSGSLILTRQKSSGDFDLKVSADSAEITLAKGNIQTTNDSVTITINEINTTSSSSTASSILNGQSIEIYISTKYEGVDINSSNNILQISKEDFQNLTTAVSNAMMSMYGGTSSYDGSDYDYSTDDTVAGTIDYKKVS